MSKPLFKKLNNLLEAGELLSIVDSAFSHSEVLISLGYSRKGQYVAEVKKFLIENDVDFAHFTSTGKAKVVPLIKTCLNCKKEFTGEKKQQTCSRACSNTFFRTKSVEDTLQYRLKALKFYDNCCVKCGYNNVLALEVHHKDRNRSNNEISNLQVLCANCHTIEHKQSD